jgi:hypothetical protein
MCFLEIYNVLCIKLEGIKPNLDLSFVIARKKIIEEEFNDEFATININMLSNEMKEYFQ